MLSRRELLLGATALPVLAQKKGAPERLNIVLLVAENLPAWMLGCYGNREIRTPNLDRLAQAGVRFVAHLGASSGAGANRSTLFSGLTAMQQKGQVIAPGSSPLTTVLGAAGYRTSAVDSTAAATAFVAQQEAAKPFFLAVNWPAPSSVAKKYYDPYAEAKLDSVNYEPAAANATRKDILRAALTNIRRAAAAASALDGELPAVLEALMTRGLLDRTLVVFTSASGALLGRHGLWGDGTGSDPINMYREVVELPLLLCWPERIPPASVRPEIVSAHDLVPTLCEVAGAQPPAGAKLCGRSYLTLAMSRPLPKKQPWKMHDFAHLNGTSMVYENRFKLVLRAQGQGPNEFFDLAKDPRERINGYADPQYVTVRDRLAPLLQAWEKNYSA